MKIDLIITLVHISSLITVVPKTFFFRNEEKLLALLVYYSFIRVATGDFRIVPFSIVVGVE